MWTNNRNENVDKIWKRSQARQGGEDYKMNGFRIDCLPLVDYTTLDFRPTWYMHTSDIVVQLDSIYLSKNQRLLVTFNKTF